MKPEEISPETIEKPWGSFRRFTLNEKSTVKILAVKKGEEFSLQEHGHRIEFWRILKGEPIIRIGKKEVRGMEGEEYTVPEKTAHRVSAPKGDVEILEISLGEFDEGDITRLEDKYGRV